MVIVVDNCRYDVGCKKTFNNFKKKNKVFLKITSTCSKLYIHSISNFFGGLFLLFLFPTGCIHSQFKSTKVIFIKVGRGHTHFLNRYLSLYLPDPHVLQGGQCVAVSPDPGCWRLLPHPRHRARLLPAAQQGRDALGPVARRRRHQRRPRRQGKYFCNYKIFLRKYLVPQID